MVNLIPKVKIIEEKTGFLNKKAICCTSELQDERLKKAVATLPQSNEGVKLNIDICGNNGENYELFINEESIDIKAGGASGAFYAIQTLRQIFKTENVPCLYINDKPDFKHRGFYHDITRGKVPTVETLKKLIDEMAYYKMNSLQLYVEHTFEFEEYKGVSEKTGYLTAKEMQELDAYCEENFIEFIPSLSTFGHLYELLQQEKYQHLRVLKDFENKPNFWRSRMAHHTIDPLNEESFELIKSLIDQYVPNFKSEYFNICCDETFDLKVYDNMGYDSGKLYLEFVSKIIDYMNEKGKKTMMWSDIVLEHPEVIKDLPKDIYLLNWYYETNVPEEKVAQLAKSGIKQILCPGTTTWNRLCEKVDTEEKNISLMAEFGLKYGADGILNTNWGDWANPCSIELAMYGLVLGAEKSWSAETELNDEFYAKVNAVLYENENGFECIKKLSDMHNLIKWVDFCSTYCYSRYGNEEDKVSAPFTMLAEIQKAYLELKDKLSAEKWVNDEYRQEMLISAEGLCVMAELMIKRQSGNVERLTDTKEWLKKYSEKWNLKNKKSELYNIEEMFNYCEENY